MDKYLEILSTHGIKPTFSIPGRVLDDHSDVVKKYSEMGVEFAVHGYQHIDYSSLSYDDSLRDLGEAVRVFKENSIFCSGCRFPYLKYGKGCMAALKELSFKWDSSHSILWDVIDETKFSSQKYLNYSNMLDQYNHKPSPRYMSLPRYCDGLLEIPVSLPDDDLLERLGNTETDFLKEIWMKILERSYTRGELFNLQLHPERIFTFKDVLISIVNRLKELVPGVWVPKIGEVCQWWEEKEGFSVDLTSAGNGEYEVDVKCTPRGTLLVQSDSLEKEKFYNNFVVQKERKFRIASNKVPIIGIPKNSPPELIGFLKNEGFIFEQSEKKGEYSLYLDHFSSFSPEDEIRTLEMIHQSKLPLIRFWRWPNGCKSALCVTGDIDSITYRDFLGRLSFGNDKKGL